MTKTESLVREAVRHWGGSLQPMRLIRDRENAVFDVTLKNGERAALRLHRPGYQSRENIEAELTWTKALSDRGFPCPAPFCDDTGAYVATLTNGRLASMVTWIDAAPIGENGVSYPGPIAEQLQLYEDIGSLIARLHELTGNMDTSALSRPSWDAEALLGETPHWGRFWENPSLSKMERAFLRQARERARAFLDASNMQTQLIHADLLQENILQNADGLHVIDFDDSGFGYPLYDLGTALIQHAEHPQLSELSQALCRGYGCRPDNMPLYIMLRAFASCGWIISRAAPNDPRQRFYAARALSCAKTYLGGH